jgi:hypothetical protein
MVLWSSWGSALSRSKKYSKGTNTSKKEIGLIFCEDENDAVALRNIALAIRPSLPRIDYCRRPLILIRDQKSAEDRRKNAADVLAVLKAKSLEFAIRFVIAHQDCDDFEPAHVALSAKIKATLSSQGIPGVVPAVPAWELEAWWYLWPAAVAAVNSKWKKLTRTGNHGRIKDGKEQLRRDLRNPERRSRDYEESDSRAISNNVFSMGIVDIKTGNSSSFEEFRSALFSV